MATDSAALPSPSATHHHAPQTTSISNHQCISHATTAALAGDVPARRPPGLGTYIFENIIFGRGSAARQVWSQLDLERYVPNKLMIASLDILGAGG